MAKVMQDQSPSHSLHGVTTDGKVCIGDHEYPLSAGRGLDRLVYPPEPSSIWFYVDLIRVVVPRRLSREELDWLDEHCGQPTKRKKLPIGRRGIRDVVRLYQPGPAVISWLAKLGRVKVERLELSADFGFLTESDRRGFWRYLQRHAIRLRRSANDRVEFITSVKDRYGRPSWQRVDTAEAAETIYDGYAYKRRGTTGKAYWDKVGKVSGEVYTVHLERIIAGKAALVRNGLERISDLNSMAWHHRFWSTRLQLRELDTQRLGKLLNCRDTGRRRTRAWIVDIGGVDFNVDKARGRTAFRDAGWSLQRLCQQHRGLPLWRCWSVCSTMAVFGRFGRQLEEVAGVSSGEVRDRGITLTASV